MKHDSRGDVLVGSPGSQERILQAIKGVNNLWWQQGKVEAAIEFIRSCEIDDEKLTTAILNVSEFRIDFAKAEAFGAKAEGK